MIRILSARVVQTEYESYSVIYRVKVPKNATESKLREMVSDVFPAHRCQHSYDCCAHWYHGSGWLRKYRAKRGSKRERIVTVSHYQNI